MEINFKKNFDKRFEDLNGGDVFAYNGRAYMALGEDIELRYAEPVNAVALSDGELCYFSDDEWIETLQFKGEWFIG